MFRSWPFKKREVFVFLSLFWGFLNVLYSVPSARGAVTEALDQYISVPVFVLTDRKREVDHPRVEHIPENFHDVFSGFDRDPGVDQFAQFQSGGGGIVHIQVRTTITRANALEAWGCKRIAKRSDAENKQEFSRETKSFLRMVGSFGCSDPFHASLAPLYDKEIFGPYKSAMSTAPKGQGVIFVHGCCLSPFSAAQSAAQLSVRLNRPVLMYDWGSSGSRNVVQSYVHSLRSLDSSQFLFERAMELTMKSLDPDNVIVIAHSLGNWLLCDYLASAKDTDQPAFREVHFVKPDISLPSFFLRTEAICSRSKRSFCYFSKNDKALWASNSASNAIPRLGRPGDISQLLESKSPTAQFPIFLDVSLLKSGHDVPYELVSDVIENGTDEVRRHQIKNTKSKCVFTVLPEVSAGAH